VSLQESQRSPSPSEGLFAKRVATDCGWNGFADSRRERRIRKPVWMSDPGLVIVGGGQAGVQAAASAREKGYAGPVDLISEEAELPYQRPHLSKGFLDGANGGALAPLRTSAWFHSNGIRLRTGERVVTIDRRACRVITESGATPYTNLVVATGARNRALSIPGAPRDVMRYLRSASDARVLREQLVGGIAVAIVGAGFIGLEVAAMAAKRNCNVTVIESQGRVLSRAVSPLMSNFLRDAHEKAGVRIRTGCAVVCAERTDSRWCLRLGNGDMVPCDLIVVGVGVVPNDDLARSAGLAVDDGVLVDDRLQTSDPNIWAIGDCVRFPESISGTVVRLESVQNACDQARTVARSLVGEVQPHRSVPWFWSEQYSHKLQIAGLRNTNDQCILRGPRERGRFSAFHFARDRLTAVESINDPSVHLAARRLLAGDTTRLSPSQAADSAFDLKSLT